MLVFKHFKHTYNDDKPLLKLKLSSYMNRLINSKKTGIASDRKSSCWASRAQKKEFFFSFQNRLALVVPSAAAERWFFPFQWEWFSG